NNIVIRQNKLKGNGFMPFCALSKAKGMVINMKKPYTNYSYPPMGLYMPPVPVMPICPMLARAYVPYQVYQMSYDLKEALDKGTLYPELYQPYVEKDSTHIKEV
ncbi:MAG: hypothetical protein PWP27_2651, partial [Clostridiales bacterium]|nr:hypothetical protein [Clostridiales bacterium]